MDEATVNQVDGVAGGVTAGDIALIREAYIIGTQIGDAINSGVEAAGGWAAYMEQVGTALGNAE